MYVRIVPLNVLIGGQAYEFLTLNDMTSNHRIITDSAKYLEDSSVCVSFART